MMKMTAMMNSALVVVVLSCFILLLLTTIDAYQITNERRGVVVVPTMDTTITRLSTYTPLHHPFDESTTTAVTLQLSSSSSSSLTNTMSGTSKSITTTNNLPPVIQQIANERAEFQINLGRAMDTLRKDMPYILSQTPDFSIYHDDISVIDPSGVQLKGIDKYKSAFTFLQTFSKFWFHQNSNTIQYRMVYDFCRNSIRISWHIVLISKFLPTSRPLHIDGISYYQLDMDSGKIMEHKIETLIVNNTPISPPYGILSILQQDVLLGNTMRPVPQGLSGAHIVNQMTT